MLGVEGSCWCCLATKRHRHYGKRSCIRSVMRNSAHKFGTVSFGRLRCAFRRDSLDGEKLISEWRRINFRSGRVIGLAFSVQCVASTNDQNQSSRSQYKVITFSLVFLRQWNDSGDQQPQISQRQLRDGKNINEKQKKKIKARAVTEISQRHIQTLNKALIRRRLENFMAKCFTKNFKMTLIQFLTYI